MEKNDLDRSAYPARQQPPSVGGNKKELGWVHSYNGGQLKIVPEQQDDPVGQQFPTPQQKFPALQQPPSRFFYSQGRTRKFKGDQPALQHKPFVGQHLPLRHNPYPRGHVNWRWNSSPLMTFGEFPPGCMAEDWSCEDK